MPRTKTGTASTTTATKSSKEMAEWYEKNKANIENYAEVSDAIKLLRDVTKTSNVSISSFDKDTVVTYLQNIGSNEQNLRKLSQALYWRSMIYYRLIDFYAGMYELDCRTVIPSKEVFNPAKKTAVNEQKMIKNYYETVNLLDTMNISRHFQDPLRIMMREDVFFGIYWLDDEGMFIFPIPADYGRIDGRYMYGNFSFSIDVTYFRSRQFLLEALGSPIEEMYREYERTGVKWQHVDDDHALCLKYNSQDYDLVVPPFLGLFLSLISLEDLSDLAAIQNEQEIYKLLIYKLKGLAGVKDSDKFEVSPTAGAKYFNKFVNEALPQYTSAAMLPGSEDIQVVSFSDDATTDTNKITKTLIGLMDQAGGAELLIGSKVTSAEALKLVRILNRNFAMSTVLPQIEGWVNMVLSLNIKNPGVVRFTKISSYEKDDYSEKLLSAAQSGMPTIFEYMGTLGYSERDTLAMNSLQSALDIPNILVPLNTSYTQSGAKGAVGEGAPKKDEGDLTDSGDRSRNE